MHTVCHKPGEKIAVHVRFLLEKAELKKTSSDLTQEFMVHRASKPPGSCSKHRERREHVLIFTVTQL